MKYTFHPEAEKEFLAAIDYYEDRELGLGSDFAIEAHSTIEHILSFPEAWPMIEGAMNGVGYQTSVFYSYSRQPGIASSWYDAFRCSHERADV